MVRFLSIVFMTGILGSVPVHADDAIQRLSNPEQKSPLDSDKVKRFLLTAAAETAENSMVTVKWSLKNISKNDLTFVESNTLRDYELLVSDQQGHKVPLTHQGALAFQASLFSSQRLVILHPGEEIEKELDLSKLYNLKRHTSYTIRLKRKIIGSDRTWSELIRSNPIKVKL